MSKRPAVGDWRQSRRRWPYSPAAPWQTASFNAVLDLVGAARRVALSELMCPTRASARAALARQIAMYLIHVDLGATLTETAHTFARERSTAAHACSKIESRRDDRSFDLQIRCLEEAVLAGSWAGVAPSRRRQGVAR